MRTRLSIRDIWTFGVALLISGGITGLRSDQVSAAVSRNRVHVSSPAQGWEMTWEVTPTPASGGTSEFLRMANAMSGALTAKGIGHTIWQEGNSEIAVIVPSANMGLVSVLSSAGSETVTPSRLLIQSTMTSEDEVYSYGSGSLTAGMTGVSVYSVPRGAFPNSASLHKWGRNLLAGGLGNGIDKVIITTLGAGSHRTLEVTGLGRLKPNASSFLIGAMTAEAPAISRPASDSVDTTKLLIVSRFR
jgi:hypothetical protein